MQTGLSVWLVAHWLIFSGGCRRDGPLLGRSNSENDRPLTRLGAAAAALVLSLAALEAPAYGCACCSNRGQRNVETQKIDAYARGILDEVRFAERALLYAGEGDPQVGGLTVASAEFRLTAAKSNAAWVLELPVAEAAEN